jgi:mRNA interferase MazF
MMFERGHIVLVPYPFTDLSASKRRPVLALTAPDGYGDFIGLPITSRPRPEHGVPLTQADMTEGTLPVTSWIRIDRIVTLSSSLVIKTAGRVSERVLADAVVRFCSHIGYPTPR